MTKPNIILFGFGLQLVFTVGVTGQPTSVRDSADVRIVQHGAFDPAVVPSWRVNPDPDLTVGVIDGPREYLLMNPLVAMILEDGTLVIQDSYRGEFGIRYYDREGRHLTTVSRWGRGPFEFHTLLGLHRLPGDSLLAVGSDGRFAIFGPQAERAREGRLGLLPLQPLLRSELVDQSHLALSKPFGDPSTRNGLQTNLTLYMIKDLRTGGVDTVAVLRNGQTYYERYRNAVLFYPYPFSSRAHEAAGDGLLWIGQSADPEVRGYNAEGGLELIIRFERPARDVTRAHRREFLEQMRRRNASNPRREYERYARMVSFPETLPYFGDLEVDRVGNLWVQLFDVPWSEADARWDVFSPDGEWMARVMVPSSLRAPCATRLGIPCDQIREIGSDYLLMDYWGPMGVRQVVRYSIEKP